MRGTRGFRSVLVAACLSSLGLAEASVLGQPPQRARRQPPPSGAAGQAPLGGQPPAAVAPATTPGASTTSAAAPEPLRTAGDRPVDIRDIKLDLHVDLEGKKVDGEATLLIRGIRPTQSLSLDAVGFEVKQVTMAKNGQPPVAAQYTYDGKKLGIDLGSRWSAAQEGVLHVVYRLQNPKDGLHFFAPSKADPDVPLCVWSQGEPTSNRYWIPCYDEPDQRQTTEIVATVPEGFEVVSNGKLLARKENPGNKTVTFDWRQEKPHPAYLVTLVVGKFDVVREEWEGIPVLYYVPKGRQAEVPPTFVRTREMLTYFSKQFGIHYPWDKYAQVMAFQFGGGMENTSATTMTERILLDERSLLDRNSDGIISHELAHQWWGDMVTCRDWSHLWLNEGFASYAEALWDEHHKGADEYAYNMYRKASGAIQGGKTRPVMDRHYSSPGSMFDGRSYPKGAWVLHMLRHALGNEAFWKGIQRYGTEYQLQSAETGDFRRAMERATGRDLERFFYDWVERPGNPDLEVTTEYLPDNQQARIVVKQTQAGEAFHFPLKLLLHDSKSNSPTIVDQEMTEKELTLRIPLPGPLTRIDVDPDQAVLAEIKETKADQLWRAQLLESSSVVARIRAAQHFGQSKTDEGRQLLARAFAGEKPAGRPGNGFWAVQTELASALGPAGGAVCRDALLQGLHSTDARVRRACIDNLGKLPADDTITKVLKEMMQKGDPSYAVEGAALTAYANQKQKDAVAVITPFLSKPSHDDVLASAALSALGQTQDPSTLETLLSWTKPGKPRNCRSAALRAMTQLAQNKNLTEPQRQQILKPLSEALESDDRFLRFTILNTLTNLGPLAASTLPAVNKLASESPDGRIQNLAKSVAEKIRAQSPASPAQTSPELSQLREEIKRLQREQENLRQRLDKYEKALPRREPAR
jgi:aminopeptidase N